MPFYNWFCRTTGFAGTPQVASAAPAQVLARKIMVRFDANVSGGLPWRFEPETNSIEVRIGDTVTVNYLATNLSARETVGQASYNVSPPTVGAYFTKINCFCFTEQRLKAGETREMPVVFFVDPELVKDCGAGRPQHHHAVLHHVSRCASRNRRARKTTRRAGTQLRR